MWTMLDGLDIIFGRRFDLDENKFLRRFRKSMTK